MLCKSLILTIILICSTINTLNVNTDSASLFENESSVYDIQVEKDFIQYFEKNEGQWNEDIEYMGFISKEKMIGFANNSFMYYHIKDRTNGSSYDEPAFAEGVSISFIFVDSNQIYPSGISKQPSYTNYFIGGNQKLNINSSTYESISYENIWNGIDIIFYFHNNLIKYDYIITPLSDIDQIKIKVEGHKTLTIEENRLFIKRDDFLLWEEIPEVYYENGENSIDNSYRLVDRDTYSPFLGDYDRTKCVIIDPILNSTFLGGSQIEVFTGLDEGNKIKLDDQGDLYISGYTQSIDFPITAGNFTSQLSYGSFITKFSRDLKTMIFSSFIGSCRVYAFDISHNGSIILTGIAGTGFPVTDNAYNTTLESGFFLTLLNANGTKLFFSTCIGEGYGFDVIFDSNGSIICGGYTRDEDFYTTNNAYDNTYNGGGDIFIMKINGEGNKIEYSTLFGGESSEGLSSLCLDDQGNVVFTGSTGSSNFPIYGNPLNITLNGQYDAFISCINLSTSEVLFSTYIGGNRHDGCSKVILDENDNIVIIGETLSYDFVVTEDAIQKEKNYDIDWFIVKLNQNASKLLYSTYLGGDEMDHCNDAVVDPNGNIYLIGDTQSSNFPTTNRTYDSTYNFQTDVVFVKLNVTSGLVYSTFIGGSFADYGNSLALDERGEVFATGTTSSSDFPIFGGAYDTTYNGGSSDAFIIRLNLSIPPTNVTDLLSVGKDNLIRLSWEPPLDLGGAPILDYQIFKGEGDGPIVLINSTSDNNYYDLDVINGREYRYRIRARNIAGEGPKSLIITAIPRRTPDPPRDLTLTSDYGVCEFEWTIPAFDGGRPIESYRIHRGDAEDNLELIDEVSKVSFNYSDHDITYGVRYYYTVRAVNIAGESENNTVINITPTIKPSIPENFVAETGDNFVNLSWIQPTDDGGSEILGYKLFKGPARDQIQPFKTLEANVNNFNDTLVQNGVLYYFRINAVNNRGDSKLSPILETLPSSLPSEPLDLSAFSRDGYVRLHWLPPFDDGGISIDNYDIFRAIDGKEYRKINTVSGEHTSFKDIDVTNGVAYRYRLTAINDRGSSEYCDEVQVKPIGVPHSPQDPVISTGDHFVQLLWHIPEYLGGDSHYSINIYKSENGEELVQFTKLDEGVTDFNDTDVENGHTYRYQLSISNSRFTSLKSEILEAVPFALPGGVRNLQAVSGDHFIHLNWLPPEDEGGFSITGYNMYIDRGEGMRFLMTIPENTTEVNYSLINGNRYGFIVLAVTEIGESNHQNWVNATPRGPPWVPLNFTVEYVGGEIHFNWDEPLSDGGSPILKYRIYRETPYGHFELFQVIPGQEQSCILKGLDVGEYCFYISSENEFGESRGSYEIELKIPEERNEVSHFILITSFLLFLTCSIIVISILIVRTKRRNLESSRISQPMDDIITPKEIESVDLSPKVK